MKRLLSIVTIICLLGLAGYFYIQKGGGVKDIEFVKLEQLKFNKVSAFPKLALSASAKAVLENPNSFGVEITRMDFDVFVEGKHTTKVTQDVSIDMPASSSFKLPLKFEIPLGKKGFFNDAKDILTGAWKNKSIKIKTQGTIFIKALKIKVEIPFEEEGDYLLND